MERYCTMTTRNWLLFLCSALLWGSSWSVVKVALGYVSPFVFSFHQSLIVTIALLPVLIAKRSEVPTNLKTFTHLLVYGLVNGINVVVSNTGLADESSGIVAVLTLTQPLLVFILSIVFLHEPVNSWKLFGIVIGLIGVSLLSLPTGAQLFTLSSSSLLLLLGAFLWASSTIYYKKYLVTVNIFVTTALQFTIGSLLLGILSVPIEGSFLVYSDTYNHSYLQFLLYNALAVSVFGNIIWLFLLRQETATNLSTYGFLIPVIALILGWGLLGEPIDLRAILGSSMILASIYTIQKDSIPRAYGEMS
jgi:drug/metabolite transporter (DMT)-like permease